MLHSCKTCPILIICFCSITSGYLVDHRYPFTVKVDVFQAFTSYDYGKGKALVFENFHCLAGDTYRLDCKFCQCDTDTFVHILCQKKFCRKKPPCRPFTVWEENCNKCYCLKNQSQFCFLNVWLYRRPSCKMMQVLTLSIISSSKEIDAMRRSLKRRPASRHKYKKKKNQS